MGMRERLAELLFGVKRQNAAGAQPCAPPTRAHGQLPLRNDDVLFSMHPIAVYDMLFRMYLGSWEVRKVVDIYVQDALRDGWECLDANGDVLPADDPAWRFARSSGLQRKVELALTQARLFGGSVIRRRTDAKTGKSYLEPVDQTRVMPGYGDGRIEGLYVDGEPMGDGCVLVFGFARGLVDVTRSNVRLSSVHVRNYPLGVSVVFPLLSLLFKSLGTQEGAYHLVNLASCLVAGVKNLRQRFAFNDDPTGDVREIIDSLSMYRGAVIDADSVSFQNQSATFGSVPELLLTFLQVLAAAGDVPATRFLGQAPGGLNATGESDLENYYNAIDAYRAKTLAPTLLKIYRMCDLGHVADVRFKPLWNRPEGEVVQSKQTQVAYVMQMVEGGIVTRDVAFDMLQQEGIIPDSAKFDRGAGGEDKELIEKLLGGSGEGGGA